MDTVLLAPLMNTVLDPIRNGFGLIHGDVKSILHILIGIEVVIFGLMMALEQNSFAASALKKLIMISIIIFAVDYWPEITKTTKDGFVYMGTKAGNLELVDLRSPDGVLNLGRRILGPAMEQAGTGSVLTVSFCALACVIFGMTAFIFVAILIFITTVEYTLVSTAAVVLLPFSIFQPLKFAADKAFGLMITFGVKLLVLYLIVGAGNQMLLSVPVTNDVIGVKTMLNLLAVAFTYGFMCWHAPAVAVALISGTPQLSTESMKTGAAAAGLAAKLTPLGVAGGVIMDALKESKNRRGARQENQRFQQNVAVGVAHGFEVHANQQKYSHSPDAGGSPSGGGPTVPPDGATSPEGGGGGGVSGEGVGQAPAPAGTTPESTPGGSLPRSDSNVVERTERFSSKYQMHGKAGAPQSSQEFPGRAEQSAEQVTSGREASGREDLKGVRAGRHGGATEQPSRKSPDDKRLTPVNDSSERSRNSTQEREESYGTTGTRPAVQHDSVSRAIGREGRAGSHRRFNSGGAGEGRVSESQVR